MHITWNKKNNYLKWIFSLAVGIFLFLFWFKYYKVKNVFYLIPYTSIYVWLLVIFSPFISLSLKALRWKYFIKATTKVKFSFKEAFIFSNLSYFINYVSPLHLGEVAKIYCLKKIKEIPYSDATAGSILDKSCDLLNFSFLPLVFFINPYLTKFFFIVFPFLILFFVIIILGIFKPYKISNFVVRFLKIFPKKLRKKFETFSFNFFYSLRVAFTKMKFSLFFGVFFQIILLLYTVLATWLFFTLLGNKISIFKIFIAIILITLIGFLPQTPAQFGTGEIIAFNIYHKLLGINPDSVNFLLLFSRIFASFTLCSLGFISLQVLGLKWINIAKLKKS